MHFQRNPNNVISWFIVDSVDACDPEKSNCLLHILGSYRRSSKLLIKYEWNTTWYWRS